jgi:hypothetical protein
MGHPERSEGSDHVPMILRFAQNESFLRPN